MAYSRQIEMPATKRDGLANFVQMVINQIENGEVSNALLTAVDLLQDIRSGVYDTAMQDALGFSAMATELTQKHNAALIAATSIARSEGVELERRRVAVLLGLEAA